MRRTRSTIAPALLFLLAALASPVAAEVSRTLRIEIPATVERFAIENLAGTLRVAPGSGDSVVAIATIHAENDELASAVRFERVTGGDSPEMFRVRYPLDQVSTIRYPGMGGSHSGWWSWLGGSSTYTSYDGHKVKVSGTSGSLVYADIEVQVPRRDVRGTFRNLVGRIDANEIKGTLAFESGSGRVELTRLEGTVKAETGSGDIEATDLKGDYSCETGSGDCIVRGFHGELVKCEAGSGTLRIESPIAKRVSAETGSGDVHVSDADIEAFDGETGSGDIDLAIRGNRFTKLRAEAGSGDVTVRLPRDASFEAIADQGSGDITSRFQDATPILKDKVLVGYRRGDARTRIDVSTGSGDLLLEPVN